MINQGNPISHRLPIAALAMLCIHWADDTTNDPEPGIDKGCPEVLPTVGDICSTAQTCMFRVEKCDLSLDADEFVCTCQQGVWACEQTLFDDACIEDVGPEPDAPANNEPGDLCDLAYGCDPAPANLTELMGADLDACRQTLTAGTLAPALLACLEQAADCGAIEACTACLDFNGAAFCREGACELAVTCGLGEDEGQCSIDCENVASGALGCFEGYKRDCWLRAVADSDCEAASACEPITF